MSNFFEELKRRNVYKVAVAYLVTAWLIIQVVSTVGPNLNWPDSIAPLTTRILLVGFPIALVLAWLYEFTPQGLKRTGAVQQDTTDNRKAGRRINRVIIGTLSLVLCVMFVERVFSDNTNINEKQKASIAVLPFDYLTFVSEDELLEEQKVLANAIPAQIHSELQQISGMKVPAKTSCWIYKDRKENVKVIAKELEVNYVLEGSIQYFGSDKRIKVSTRLINGNNGWTLWSENFEDDLYEIESIQEKIGRKVASRLRVELLPNEEEILAAKLSQDKEAALLYIRAKEYASRGTSDDVDIAVELLNKALDLDGEFAEAHAELSQLYGVQHFMSNLHKEERDTKVEYHLDKAIEYGPEKPEVLVASASRKIGREDKDSSRVIAKLRKAININSNYAQAYWMLARALNWARQPNFMKYVERAYELDPFNVEYANAMADWYFNNDKDHNKAFATLDRIIQKDSVSQASRYKAFYLLGAPFGEIAQAFILIHEAGKKDPNDVYNLNYHLLTSLELDLVPVAERYGRLLQMGYPENEYHTYGNLSSLYIFKGEYNKWLDMVDFWAARKGLNRETEAMDRVYIQMGLGNVKKARSIFEKAFPNLLATDVPKDDIMFYRKNYDELVTYTELLRLDKDNDKADALANALFEFYKMGPAKNERASLSFKNQVLLDCHYLSNDTIAFIKHLQDRFFTQKDRFEVFTIIEQGSYKRFEKNKDVSALFERIRDETHRMRAEVIAYLKKEGEWDPAWDKELGLE